MTSSQIVLDRTPIGRADAYGREEATYHFEGCACAWRAAEVGSREESRARLPAGGPVLPGAGLSWHAQGIISSPDMIACVHPPADQAEATRRELASERKLFLLSPTRMAAAHPRTMLPLPAPKAGFQRFAFALASPHQSQPKWS